MGGIVRSFNLVSARPLDVLLCGVVWFAVYAATAVVIRMCTKKVVSVTEVLTSRRRSSACSVGVGKGFLHDLENIIPREIRERDIERWPRRMLDKCWENH